jgi:HD-GYP domain-containing protein (c-di-GMP phosphodiesterase class II)
VHQLQTSPRTFRLKSRASLIAATLSLQAVVIGLGGYLTLRAAKSHLEERVGESASLDNARAAEAFLKVLTADVQEPFEYASPEWERVQNHVKTFALPAGAQLVVLDDHGRVLCHPQMETRPGLRTLDIAAQVVQLDGGDQLIELSRLSPSEVRTGVSESIAGRASLAVAYVPSLGVKVLVYRPQAVMSAAAAKIGEQVMVWCAASGLVLLGVSLVGSSVLVRKYDSMVLRVNAQLEHEVERRTRRGLSIRNALVFGLAKLADYRDTDTGAHLERICRYCVVLAQELSQHAPEIDHAWIERLRVAASMHDIGKVGIPDAILLKPGRLTDQERRIMQTHPVIGADTLLAVRRRVGDDDLLTMGIEVAISHHERWDGTGYPFGLKGEHIPLSGRIVAVADVYDALTSRRVYKDALGHEQAVAAIRDSAGTHFDPRVVESFLRVAEQFNQVRASAISDVPERPRLESVVERARLIQEQSVAMHSAAEADAIPFARSERRNRAA